MNYFLLYLFYDIFLLKEGSYMAYYLYMLRCENGSIYTGTAKDYLKRYEEHLNGKGAKYTKKKKEAVVSKPDDFIKDIENNGEIKIEKIF